ncbi:MAG: hypothetical protein J1E06_09655 [Acutalibacter sp.]|nr:hypothetical protein [Acutalibacter sp.]
MKNRNIINSLNKIEPHGSADSRMLSAILAENRRVRGEKETSMTIHKKKVGKRALVLAISVALVFSLAIGVGASGAFGRLFGLITQNDSSDFYNAKNRAVIAERMEPVADEVTATQAGNLKFSVKEAYYDGMTLYCAGEIETDLDPNAKQTAWNYDIFINGVPLDFDYSLHARKWVKTEDGKYVNDSISTKIPPEFRPAGTGDIQVKYVATHYSYGSEGETVTHGTLEAASSEFTVALQDETISITETVVQNNVKFRYLLSSPATTEVCIDVPRELAGYYGDLYSGISLFTEKGQSVSLNSGSENYSDEDPEYYRKLIYSGEAIPQGVTKLIAQVNTSNWEGHTETVTARFEIDLAEKTVTPISDGVVSLEKPVYPDK